MLKIGDRVRSTNHNATPMTVLGGTILDIEGKEDADGNVIEARWIQVEQDDGVTAWWSA